MTITKERRVAGGNVSSNDSKALLGYAALCNDMTNIGEFCEIIAPGAFDSAMQRGDDVRLLLNHDPNHILARTKSGTLVVASNAKGLGFVACVADTQVGRDTLTLVRRGDLAECSFGFVVGPGNDTWTTEKDSAGNPYVLRTIHDFDEIQDVSVVAFPAYKNTSVDARNVLPDAVLAEARSHGAKPGKLIIPTKKSSLYISSYVPLTRAQIQEAREEFRRLHGTPYGATPTGVDIFIAAERAKNPKAPK